MIGRVHIHINTMFSQCVSVSASAHGGAAVWRQNIQHRRKTREGDEVELGGGALKGEMPWRKVLLNAVTYRCLNEQGTWFDSPF